ASRTARVRAVRARDALKRSARAAVCSGMVESAPFELAGEGAVRAPTPNRPPSDGPGRAGQRERAGSGGQLVGFQGEEQRDQLALLPSGAFGELAHRVVEEFGAGGPGTRNDGAGEADVRAARVGGGQADEHLRHGGLLV